MFIDFASKLLGRVVRHTPSGRQCVVINGESCDGQTTLTLQAADGGLIDCLARDCHVLAEIPPHPQFMPE